MLWGCTVGPKSTAWLWHLDTPKAPGSAQGVLLCVVDNEGGLIGGIIGGLIAAVSTGPLSAHSENEFWAGNQGCSPEIPGTPQKLMDTSLGISTYPKISFYLSPAQDLLLNVH